VVAVGILNTAEYQGLEGLVDEGLEIRNVMELGGKLLQENSRRVILK
jgi:hypothetical protein|tara:strand:- start:1258 stop:1398 length:141 start_codon:yes stop_codon:yes gene_type:complete